MTMTEGDILWFIMRVQSWDSMTLSPSYLLPGGKLHYPPELGMGFMLVFNTREEAEASCKLNEWSPADVQAMRVIRRPAAEESPS